MALYDAHEMRIVDGPAPVVIPSRYGQQRRVSWPMLAAIIGVHLVLAMILDLAGVLPVRRAPSELKVIQLSPEMAPPPVVKAELPQTPQPQPEQQPQVQPEAPTLDAPAPIVRAPTPEPVQTVAPAPPPPAAPVASGPVRVS